MRVHFPAQRQTSRDRSIVARRGQRPRARLAHLRYGGLKMPCDLTEMLQRQFYFFGISGRANP
jgi:hypothetical protein